MSASQIILKEDPPKVVDFASLRSIVGWENPELSIIQASIDSSLFWVSLYLENQLIGCGRVIGDDAMYFYVQDIIVNPEHQKRGLGFQIMQSINRYLTLHCPVGSTVGLLSAYGKEKFYEKFGFTSRDGQTLGLGMCKFI
jgi:GNAT superfamily N-acetyltransferase